MLKKRGRLFRKPDISGGTRQLTAAEKGTGRPTSRSDTSTSAA